MIFDRSKGQMRIQVTAATAAMLLAITFSACKKEPFLVGDLNDGTIQYKEWGDNFTAKPATAADEIPTPQYIEPPALHPVPSNGLAKTPPMGWNSWNLFAEKVDDQIVRTMADAMVSSGMKDAGYIYVNI